LIVMLLGVVLVIAALVDTLDFAGPISADVYDEWPRQRIGLLVAGVLIAVWGGYSLSQKSRRKK
jgi:hypothetical protein